MRSGIATMVICGVVAGALSLRGAGAVKPFLEQFKAVYVNPRTTDHTMRLFNAAVEKKGCTLCHGGTAAKPTVNNAYGEQLKKLLNGKRDGGNPQAIRSALKIVARMHSDPANPSSPTSAQRLKQGKLPVGEIRVRSKDPANQGSSSSAGN